MMEKEVLPLGPIEANCIILWSDPAKAWIVDPGADAEAIAGFCERRGLVPGLVALTHGHFDHIGSERRVVPVEIALPVKDGKVALPPHSISCIRL